MKSKSIAVLAGALAGAVAISAAAQGSKDWVDIKNPKDLRAIYSNKTFRGRGAFGDPFVAHYRADGKALLILNSGERIPRTWQIKGRDQVCYKDAKYGDMCFHVQRHRKNRNEIITQHVKDRWISQVTVEDGVPDF